MAPADGTQTAKLATDASLNVLLIIGDDIGVDILSGYEEQPNYAAQTPRLDQFAEQGVLFRNTWANAVCSPTRASILTGRYAFRHGVTYTGGATAELSQSEETVAEILSRTAYKSALFGKWHLGNSEGSLPTDNGFDYFSGSISNLDDYFNWTKTQASAPESVATSITETRYASDVISVEAADWIAQQSGPWFVTLGFNAPHSPFHVPPIDSYQSYALSGDVGDACNNASADDNSSCYRAAVEAMDFYIGRLIDSLNEDTLAKTIVIFVGDNGTPSSVIIEEAGLPFVRGHGKDTMYEGGVNVPMIIWGGAQTGVDHGQIAAKVIVQDLFSTIVELAGQSPSASITIDGQSLLGYLDDETDAPAERDIQYSELFSENQSIDRWAITDGQAKFISNDGVSECYDLLNDAAESNNLIENENGNESQTKQLCEQLELQRPCTSIASFIR
ncbi:sulfatase-like hydrolase/transferase [Congregibacter brevis]|uniref:Sulfatase-like hydrolase/transferase n=1 Tax=Congregibacter brevis TaxID=3081201 RepID=A0ABZ0IEJ0_9GAMM|nr:sulfatase-like hydrolase/transferase [Congregibacter sp. IMCC45268]